MTPPARCKQPRLQAVKSYPGGGSTLALTPGVNCLVAIAVLSASLGGARFPSSGTANPSTAANPGSPTSMVLANRFSSPSTLDLEHTLGNLWRRVGNTGSGKGWMATPWLRLHVSTLEGSHSGIDAGASVLLFQGWIQPTLSIDGGRCSGGDISSMVRVLTRSPRMNPALLRGFAYEYTSAYAGVEMSNDRVALSINLGVTRAKYASQDIQGALEAVTPHGASPSELASPPRLSPAARLVLLVRI